jgi:hypothetical protein
MFERCIQLQISLNLKKCIFCTPFGIFWGHVVCKHGLLVDPANIVVIGDFPPPTSVRKLRATLGHTRYYMKFIRGYVHITSSIENIVQEGGEISIE